MSAILNDRLEFVNAGWSMHDEACTRFPEFILVNKLCKALEYFMGNAHLKSLGYHVNFFFVNIVLKKHKLKEKEEAEADEELEGRLVKVRGENAESALKDKEDKEKGKKVLKEVEDNFKKESSMITE
jgi:hypothetical protein